MQGSQGAPEYLVTEDIDFAASMLTLAPAALAEYVAQVYNAVSKAVLLAR